MAANIVGGQKAEYGKEVTGNDAGGAMQALTVHNVPPMMKDGTTIDMDIVQNYLKFFSFPTENLEYIKTRIKELRETILDSVVGTIANQNNQSQNQLQVRSGFSSAEDKIRGISGQLSRIRQRTDFNILALKHGRDRVHNHAFYGSKFYFETEEELYDLFKQAPNPIERENTILKISRSRNRFNKENATREFILYKLIPYVADIDFKTAIDSLKVDDITFHFQSRFPHWIGLFESQYGDIVTFWEGIEATNAEKITLINNLIIQIINQAILPQQTES